MDTLFLDIHIIPSGSFLRIDGIDFKSCAFVVPREGSLLAKIPQLHEAVIVPKELIRSTQGSGKYLIFTDASGIADDGGWTGVEVKFIQNGGHWIFLRASKISNVPGVAKSNTRSHKGLYAL